MPTDREYAILDALARLVVVFHEHEKDSRLRDVVACDVVDGELLLKLSDNSLFALTIEEM